MLLVHTITSFHNNTRIFIRDYQLLKERERIMQGNQAVIDYMNELLSGELAARDQYFIHSRLYSEWGYTKLFERI